MPTQIADLTTLHVGGPADQYVQARTEAELIAIIKEADTNSQPLLVLGGGSNVLVGDTGFPGVVVRDMRQDITVIDSSECGGTTLRVAAGATWDHLVQYAVDNDAMGIEALSGIPGTVGAAPVQNIGAYGQDVAETLAAVKVWDRAENRTRRLAFADLQLGYRTSILKRSLVDPTAGGGRTWGPTGRWVVLEAEFQLRNASLSAPIRYRELAATLGVQEGDRAPMREVRQAVLDLRRGKGMVYDPANHDTWSAGSFFTNPILTIEDAAVLLPEGAPQFPAGPGQVKTSAAWLISHAGFARGHRVAPGNPAALSSRHVLALTNRGGASAADILQLAASVRRGVQEHFGITLVPEPVLVNCQL